MKKAFLTLLTALMILTTAVSALGETLVMSFLGDCTIGDQYKYRGYGSSFTGKTAVNGMDYPFSLSVDILSADDLTVANCEGVFTTRKPGKNAKDMTLGADPKWAEVLQLGDVQVCNVANNHMEDFGRIAVQDTMDALAAVGIGSFGDDVTFITEVKGVKIGFVGYSYPHTDEKLNRYARHIRELREAGCDFIIASAHWGKEESLSINVQQRTYAPRLIDAGADMVYGHGSHTLQPIQIYKGKVIFYSLSNFVFGANAKPKDDDTAILQVTFEINEDNSLTAKIIQAYPYKMHKNKDFRPWPLTEEKQRLAVFKKLYFTKAKDPDSGLPETFLTTGYAEINTEAAEAE